MMSYDVIVSHDLIKVLSCTALGVHSTRTYPLWLVPRSWLRWRVYAHIEPPANTYPLCGDGRTTPGSLAIRWYVYWCNHPSGHYQSQILINQGLTRLIKYTLIANVRTTCERGTSLMLCFLIRQNKPIRVRTVTLLALMFHTWCMHTHTHVHTYTHIKWFPNHIEQAGPKRVTSFSCELSQAKHWCRDPWLTWWQGDACD